MLQVEEKVSELEELVKKLAYMQVNTQISIDRMSKENEKRSMDIDRICQENEKRSMDIKELGKKVDQTTRNVDKVSSEIGMLTRKFGTLVEDIVIPNIEGIAKRYFNLQKGNIHTRMKIWNKDVTKQKEFDVIAVYPDKIIVNETMSNPSDMTELKKFVQLIKKEFFDYFPEYQGKELIPIFASFHIPDNVKTFLNKHKIYAMAMREDTMDIVNFGEF